MELKYAELLRRNTELKLPGPHYRVAVLGNTTIAFVKEILEYFLRMEGIPAEVTVGEYDNVVQDSAALSEHDCVAVFLEAANFVDGIAFRQLGQTDDETRDVVGKVKTELDFIFRNLSTTPLVLFNRFSALPFSAPSASSTLLEEACVELNAYLEAHAPRNFRLVNIDKLYAQLSVAESTDLRRFLSARSLYTTRFYMAYARHVRPYVLNATGRVRKALVFDCDNTLWKGILGEDGPGGIRIYKEIQSMAVALARSGIIVALCSKNNPEDVDAVLAEHPEMVLRDDHVVIKAVNWQDKAANLRDIAKTLNIGTDSLVFVDDSEFELGLIRRELPEVKLVQVPAAYPDYVQVMQEVGNLFWRPGLTSEDRQRVQQYKVQMQRELVPSGTRIEDYLASLGLRMTIHVDAMSQIPRIAQLTQKTNQFNLTTKRYTEAEIERFMRDDAWTVFALELEDRYGPYGVTGALIAHSHGNEARIDTFLLSCRILGRRIEDRFMIEVLASLARKGAAHVLGEFVRTAKNRQVESFYDKFGQIVARTDSGAQYSLDTSPADAGLEFIEVNYA